LESGIFSEGIYLFVDNAYIVSCKHFIGVFHYLIACSMLAVDKANMIKEMQN